VGSTSAPQVVTILNNAATAQNISWLASGNYSAVPGDVTPCGSSLGSVSACTLNVTFSPTTTGTNGTVKGSLAVTDTATGVLYNPQLVDFSGTATGGTTPSLAFSPSSLNFTNVAIGSTKAASAVMQNTSSSSLTLLSMTSSGEYTVTPSGTVPCTNGLVLASKAKCGFTVSLTPTTGGSILGSVTISDNASSGATTQTYNMAAIGFWPITLAPATLSFPATSVGGTSAPLQVTVTNYSTVAVTLNSFVASGDYAVVSLGSSPCSPGTVLNPGAACTLGVTFSPTITGTITGAMTVSHSAPNGPQVVGLTGKGQ
jgi:hypothetical protein